MYTEERIGKFNYLGYIKPKRTPTGMGSSPTESHQFITIQFEWEQHLKPESSSFIGTSPEFEFSLYSLAFFLGKEKCIVQCAQYKLELTAFKMLHRGKTFIGSSFPAEAQLETHEAATKIQNVTRQRQAIKKVDSRRASR